MAESLRDQLLKKGVVKPEDTAEARRAREKASRPPPAEEKDLPPPFEPPASGRIIQSPRSPKPKPNQ